MKHIPVLERQVVGHLRSALLKPKSLFLDLTFGAGGHTSAILKHCPEASAVVCDRDPLAIRLARELQSTESRIAQIHQARFSALSRLLEPQFGSFDALLLDAGVSSMQLDTADRGFSFVRDGPLDMRMSNDDAAAESAGDVVNGASVDELANIIKSYGEEKFAYRIAKAIDAARPIHSTATLAQIVKAVVPVSHQLNNTIHPATRTFQALRIHVNDEMAELSAALLLMSKLLRSGGLAAVISFHSLEDRMVKHFFRDCAHLSVINKHPFVADEEESHNNPRSRSAKMRIAERV